MKQLMSVVLAAVCFTAGAAAQTDVVSKLGSNMTEAQEAIFSAFSGGTVYMIGTADVFKTAGAQARAAMVTAVIGVARTYSTSADFARRYAMFREEQKPEPSTPPVASADAMNQQMRTALETGIKNLEETAKKMPQMKKQFDEQIAAMRKQLEGLGKDKKADAQMDQILKEGAQSQAAEHAKRLAQWEKDYPVDPKPFIARRLQEFLALSATVDFNAAVAKSQDGTLKFTNPAYERKDNQWKYLYRAGKPAVDAARASAQEWLKSLGG